MQLYSYKLVEISHRRTNLEQREVFVAQYAEPQGNLQLHEACIFSGVIKVDIRDSRVSSASLLEWHFESHRGTDSHQRYRSFTFPKEKPPIR